MGVTDGVNFVVEGQLVGVVRATDMNDAVLEDQELSVAEF